jgi:general secretion pathway protein F
VQYSVQAVNRRQQVVGLQLEAANEVLAAEAARRQGLAVLSVRPHGLGLARVLGLGRRGAFPTMLFSIELRSLLEAGLNLVEALHALAEKEPHGERQAVLSGMLAALHRGESFSQAVAGFPQHFPPLYVATIRASERTGDLREALARYIAYQEELERVRKKIVSASIYPVILIAVGALVLAFLMFYVVPRFARVYEDVSGSLPFFSELLLAAGRFVSHHGMLLGSAALALALLGAWGASQPAFRAWASRQLWRIPALGERMKVYQLARLYRTTGMLLRAGIPAVRALDMVRDLLAAHLRAQLAQAKALIEQGWQMSAAFGAAGLATPVAARMMAVGERSGDMGEMLAQIARFHDDEVSRYVDWFTRAFEPILMGVLGVSVGVVVVLMYMPIFELAGNIR